MFTNILIPTDGSEFSEKVVGPGVELAKAMHARITAVHVYPRHHMSPYGEFGPSDDVVEAQMRERAQEAAKQFLDRIGAAAQAAGVDYERVVIEDDQPWKGLLDTARQKGCDLIMMAAHDRHGLAARMLGSETNKVLSHASMPVMVFH